MPPSSLEERRARLQALLERYCVEAQERLQTIHTAREDYARGDTHALRILSLQAHTLAGSGATMGFPALSEAASALDSSIAPFLKNPQTLEAASSASLEIIDTLLPPLEKAIKGMKIDGLADQLLQNSLRAQGTLL